MLAIRLHTRPTLGKAVVCSQVLWQFRDLWELPTCNRFMDSVQQISVQSTPTQNRFLLLNSHILLFIHSQGVLVLGNQLIPNLNINSQQTYIKYLRIMSLHKLLLLIALFAVAQMIHLSQETHEMSQIHDATLDINNGNFPQKVRIVYDYNPNYGLHPNGDHVKLEIIRDVGHNEADKARWTMIKNTDGSFSFQSYDGRRMKCPDNPTSTTHLLILSSPGTSINQKFRVELVSSTVPSYRIRCLESGHPFISSNGYNANVDLKKNYYGIWHFGIA